MEAADYLAYISKVIHTTVVATVDDDGLPVTAAIDMMVSRAHRVRKLLAHRARDGQR